MLKFLTKYELSGVRSPSSIFAQKDFRTAWVVFHRPGVPPTFSQQQHIVNILNTWSDVYEISTIGRGTMDNTTVNHVGECEPAFDVYIGTTNPPTELVCSGSFAAACDPGLLECDTTYFWRIWNWGYAHHWN